MDKNILDASVIIKWFIKEEGNEQADFYLERLNNQEIAIVIPQLLYYEVGNTLIFKKIQKNDSDEIARKLYSLPLEVKQIGSVIFREITRIAETFGITFYDAVYVTLMTKERCEFITADRKLFQKVNKTFSGIKLL